MSATEVKTNEDKTLVIMLYKIFAVLTAMKYVMSAPPGWTTPTDGATITLDASVNTACDKVTDLLASSGDGTTVSFSVFSQTPAGGFDKALDGNTGNDILKCNLATIKASTATTYSVTLRASNSGVNADITITIVVKGLNANAPVFSGTPYNIKVCRDKINCLDDISLPYVLLRLIVTDADNNTVTLSLPDADPAIFTTENHTIKVNGSLVSLSSPYELKVVATDNGTPPKNSSATVTLTLGYAPKFTDPSNSSDVIYLCETSIGGDELIKLQASDTDTPIANLIFSMDNSPTETKNLFEIVGDLLKVKSSVPNGTFDYEKPNAVLQYNISLKVSDGAFSSILNTQIVLEDFNDNPPVFLNTPYTKSILEATTPGSSVLQVSATDADKTSPNNVVTFTLSGSNDFTINNTSGVISVAAGVTLNYSTTPSYSLTVTAIDGGGIDNLTATALVTLKISTKPTFDNLALARSVTVEENVAIGTSVFALTVTDRDNTGPLSYFIKTESVSGAFVLNGSVLQTAKAIDKETLSSYTISFNVTDGTYTADSALLTININDVNEKPTISVPNSPVKILESTVAGTPVFNVSASDPDISAPNNVITFGFLGSSDFSITNSGVVSVATGKTLNYTRQPSYELVMIATDGGTPPLSSSSTVTVTLLTKPTFDTLTSPQSTSVNENVPIGTSVFTVSVSDKDNSGGTLQLVIRSQSVIGAFVLNGSILQTAINIDRETKNSYTISFNVSDGTYSVDSAILTITVNDVNEKPTISVPNSPVKILESTVAGTQVFNVSASDPDMSAPNNVITFSLSGSGSSDFSVSSINASSGVVSVASGVTLNYTRQPSYQLVITANDGGTPSLSSSSTVNISLLTKPTFDTLTSPISTSVNENVPIGTSVFKVAVSDKDNSGGTLQPVIKSQSVNGAFVLNGSIIQTAINIDRETKDSYTISFSVTDGTYSVDSAILTINVNDVNEKPTISVPNSPIKLLESTVTGTQVFNVSASDPDKSAPNNLITYSLSGSGSSDFSISSSTGSSGVVSVASGVTLNYTRQASYQLVITAMDGGTPPLSSSSTVTVSLLTKPTFNNLGSPSTASVNENVPIGTSVFTVTVSDKDNSSGGTLQPVIKSQSTNGAFVLNGTILQTATNIDREALSSYTITFSVTDGTYTVDSALLTVNVNDVNEKPTISVPNSPVKILESTVAGTQVFNVSASDPDMSAPNNVIEFGFLGSSDFSVTNSGVVSVASGKTLNYTRQPSYELVMIAKDGGTPSLSSSSTVTVSILTKPTFDTLTSAKNILIDENVPIGSSVFTVAVSDKDNSGGTLQPVIKSQSENGAFVLNGSILQTAKKIDRETLDSYMISFNVTDGTFTTESGILSITVSDLNDNPPLINPVPDIIKIGKNKAAGKVVLYIRADDADATQANNVLTYSIIDGNGDGYFSLNESSGLLELVKYPDSTDPKKQSLKVKVVDGGTPQLSATVNFSVEFSKNLIEHKVEMSVNGTCPNLTIPSEYTRTQKSIEKMLRDELKIEGVIVFNIRCGSISFDSTILTNDTESDKTALAERLQQIENGKTLSLDSEYVTAKNITVNDNTISQNASVCEVFITINPCGPDHQCSYEKGTASCKLEKPLNTDLIIGLCIGLILPLLAILIMLIVAVSCKRRRRRHKSKKSSSLNGSTEPRRDKFRGHRWQGDFHMPGMVGYTNHAFTNGVKGGHTKAGQSKRDFYGISSI